MKPQLFGFKERKDGKRKVPLRFIKYLPNISIIKEKNDFGKKKS